MTDENDLVVLRQVAPGLVVHLGHQRAGRIDHGEILALGCRSADSGRHPVRGQDDGCAVGDVFELGHEDRTLGLEVGHDMHVMDDLAADEHRPAEPLQRPLDDFDRPFDAGAERPRAGEQHVVRTAGAGPAFE